MTEFVRGDHNFKANNKASVGPGGKEHYVPYTDLATLAKETTEAVRRVYENRRVATSWVGSEPKNDPEATSLWTEQATRELMGYTPTVMPTSRYLEKMMEAPRMGGTVVDFRQTVVTSNGVSAQA